MGLNFADEEEFKNNVRELLLTDNNQCTENSNCQQDVHPHSQAQFDGEPVKGSFLRDMEILGKTISF